MWYILAFALVIAVPGLIYAIIAHMEIPGLAEQRFGPRKGLPAVLNEWTTDEATDTDSGNAPATAEHQRIIRDHPELATAMSTAVRETRLWRDPSAGPFSPGGFFRRSTLTLQVRYRNSRNDEIVHAEPDRLVNLRRTAK